MQVKARRLARLHRTEKHNLTGELSEILYYWQLIFAAVLKKKPQAINNHLFSLAFSPLQHCVCPAGPLSPPPVSLRLLFSQPLVSSRALSPLVRLCTLCGPVEVKCAKLPYLGRANKTATEFPRRSTWPGDIRGEGAARVETPSPGVQHRYNERTCETEMM